MAQEKNYSKSELDNYANQLNPNNGAYWTSRGFSSIERELTQAELDNRSRQLNPNDELYRMSRGYFR